MMTNEVRQKYLDFFKKRGHVEVPSSPLVPEDDPTTLFTGSGMQPLLPYFLGKRHPSGSRITNSQKCFRTVDIDEVGDNRHTTFFEMLGNWSFGDYFKKEQLEWSWQFCIEELGLEPSRLYATVFSGYEDVPRDDEAVTVLQAVFRKYGVDATNRIADYGADKNWWSRVGAPDQMPVGEPGGPTSEIFYDFGEELGLHEQSELADQACHLNCDCGRFLEIGNSVFMTYVKQEDGSLKELPKKNIDFGGGLERMVAATEDTPDVFLIDSFKSLLEAVVDATGVSYEDENQPPMRIIADHLKGATFLITDGVRPSNKDQGYYLRRLLRRAATQFYVLTGELAPADDLSDITRQVVGSYDERYLDVGTDADVADGVINEEMEKFNQAFSRGLKEIEKADPAQINGELAFHLYQSYGLPFEVTRAVLQKQGHAVSQKAFDEAYQQHQKVSRAGAKKKFRSGLADQTEATVKLHTATHLLHQALRNVLGEHVQQKGSNITAERLRLDFSHPEKLTDDEITRVEAIVNEKIAEDLPVTVEEMPYQQAIAQGALAFFGGKYPEVVTVYSIGDFSKEVCTGPHVERTGKLGQFKIVKQESVGKGVRRIRAILE